MGVFIVVISGILIWICLLSSSCNFCDVLSVGIVGILIMGVILVIFGKFVLYGVYLMVVDDFFVVVFIVICLVNCIFISVGMFSGVVFVRIDVCFIGGDIIFVDCVCWIFIVIIYDDFWLFFNCCLFFVSGVGNDIIVFIGLIVWIGYCNFFFSGFSRIVIVIGCVFVIFNGNCDVVFFEGLWVIMILMIFIDVWIECWIMRIVLLWYVEKIIEFIMRWLRFFF